MPIKGGFNETAIMFGQGGIANFSTGLQRNLDSSGFVFRLLDHAVFQLNPKLSLAVAGIVQLDNGNGDSDGAMGESSRGNLWVSAGARPVYMLGKYTGIAAEVGLDLTQPEAEDANSFFVGKITVAPLIRAGGSFWARPEIRAFVTAAFWNSDAKGAVGGAAFADDSFGLTAGVQLESWW
jgi:maltoporin